MAINLLPPEQKEELLKEDKLKIVAILGLAAIAVLAAQILLLLLIKNYLGADLEIQKIYSRERAEELQAPALGELEDKIKSSGQTFTQLDSFYKNQKSTLDVLEKISATLPESVYLTSLNFIPVSSQVSLTGFSPTREKLLSLRENLEKEKIFSNVYFPQESWVNPADINFNVVFKLK